MLNSTCMYLFNREPKEIFPKEETAFLEESLSLLMRVNAYLLSQKEVLFILDPNTCNNQCHLLSYQAAEIESCPADKMVRNENNRFLHLSFLLSLPLNRDKRFFVQVVDKALKGMQIKHSQPQKFKRFLMDDGRLREKSARKALNQLFAGSLQSMEGEGALYNELRCLANEPLVLEKDTYPKFAGVVLFIEKMQKAAFPIIFKIKVLNDSTPVIVASPHAEDFPCALVLEAIAHAGMSFEECRAKAKSCPQFAYRFEDKNKVHALQDRCFFCQKGEGDMQAIREVAEKALLNQEKMLMALGAHFILNQQPYFKGYFENRLVYPLLSELFSEGVKSIEAMGLSAFSICHMHPDHTKEALKADMQIDTAPELLLKKRGLL